jgi:hypothetical protein
MSKNAPLSKADLRKLQTIEEHWVSATHWDDKPMKRYRGLGLLECDGNTISLTDSGRRACATTPVLSLYHPI